MLVFAAGSPTAGVPAAWAAMRDRAGVAWLPDRSPATVEVVARAVERLARRGDVVVLSLHWGPNWCDAVTAEERRFAHALVTEAGVDVLHGHSSHHVRGIEVHEGRLILYGCGDLLTDYEGIHGHARYRGELGLLYFPTIDAGGRLLHLEMVPTQVRRLRIMRAGDEGQGWLAGRLEREDAGLGTGVERDEGGRLRLRFRA